GAALVNVLTVKLHLTAGQELCDGDYDRLNALLTCGLNDIYVMPFLEFDGVCRTDHLCIYRTFVEKMLERRSSWTSEAVERIVMV
ncbi:MAG: hypothetical protein MJZ68_09230, partial [archaeon]|nr:hypothetical protein [archaeon]